MNLTLTLSVLAFALPLHAQGQGQTIAVEAGTRLEISGLMGEVTIRTWSRNEVTLDDSRSDRPLVLTRTGQAVQVRPNPTSLRRGEREVKAVVTVPTWMPININGVNLEVDVEGSGASVRIETVNGDVRLEGGRGVIDVGSVSGDVAIRGANGRIAARSVNGELGVADSEGELIAETSNGEITLERIRSSAVTATSVNGGVSYEGTINPDGRYKFGTHNGSILLVVPEDVSATVNVSTYRGEFHSDFPVTLSEGRIGTRFRFVLRSGGAQLDLESFQGSVTLTSRSATRRR